MIVDVQQCMRMCDLETSAHIQGVYVYVYVYVLSV